MSNRQKFKSVDLLRLEVEVPPTGLTNLVPNPDGALGAWGWITPVAGSFIEGGVQGPWYMPPAPPFLSFTAPATSAPSYFTTEPMSVVAGQYASASWDLASISGYVRARFEWLNAAQAVVATSTQSGYLNTTGRNAYAPQLAPAGAAFMRLRFDHYSNTSGANPVGSAKVALGNVKVAKASASGALGSGRTNLIVNPSLETTAADWYTSASEVARSTAVGGFRGTAALRITRRGDYPQAAAYPAAPIPVTAGRDYVISAYTRAATTPRAGHISVNWTDASGQAVAEYKSGPLAVNTTSGWTRISRLVTVPAGITGMYPFIGTTVEAGNGPAGEVHYFDAIMVTQGVDLADYFDGSTAAAGTLTYAWNGTAHASTSTLTDTTLGSLVPTVWRNILGPTHEIKVEREDLNLGLLNATVMDATLDPSQSDQLRPGRRTRLLTLVAGGRWEPLFTGDTTKLEVTYDEKVKPPKPPRVALSAVDPIRRLAAARRPDGVSLIADLPYVLEGAGVPWNVNGSGNQVPTAIVVSTNENATALDQVAVTRDSRLGLAYVNRAGVLVAKDYVAPATFPNGTFDVNANGWTGLFGATLARVTTPTRNGAGALRITATGTAAGAYSTRGTGGVPVSGGTTYTFGASFRSAAVSRPVNPLVVWYDVAGNQIAGYGPAGIVTSTSAWTQWALSLTAPPRAAYVALDMTINDTASGQIHYMDDAFISSEELVYGLWEDVYSDLDVSFSSEKCINSVTVTYLRLNAADGTTEEIVYGPYERPSSIAEWGRCAAEFTVQGIGEANVPAYAEAILNRNATPVAQVNSVTIPIKEPIDTIYSLIDLADKAQVQLLGKGINQTLRVNSITHRITPRKWLIDLGFQSSTSVAAPATTPPVQNNAEGFGDTDWTTVFNFQNAWTDYGAGFEGASFRRRSGVVYWRGMVRSGSVADDAVILNAIPPGFRPASIKHMPVATAAGTGVLKVYHDGTLRAGTPMSANWTSLAGLAYPAEQ